jgi:hypothetical protein
MKVGTLAAIAILICSFALAPNLVRADENDWYQGQQGQWVKHGKSGVGQARTAISGIKENRDTGTRTRKAGIGMATMVTSIAKDPMAGNGPASIDSTIALEKSR